MSWSDIFYPDNPKRRDQVVEYFTKFNVLMEFNFDATNTLVDLLNKNVTPSPELQHIALDKNASIGDNAQTMINRMDEIQKVVDKIDSKLADELEPTLYKELNSPDTSFKEKFAIAKKSITSVLSIGASVAGIAMVAAIKAGYFLRGMVSAMGVIKTSAVAGLVLGVIVLGIDMIASAIIGAVERGKLEDAIDQFETALATFEPASKEYTKTVTRVEIRLEILLED